MSRMRFERMTLWLKVKCSTCWANGTYYIKMAASARFELAHATVKVWCLTAWLRGNNNKVVEGNGFEPLNPKEQIYSLPRLTTSLSLHKKVVPEIGLEPTTYWLQVSCSTNWAIPAHGGRYRTRTYDPLLVRQVL